MSRRDLYFKRPVDANYKQPRTGWKKDQLVLSDQSSSAHSCYQIFTEKRMPSSASDIDCLATLERIFDAFNRHDIDAVMLCFTGEAVFLAAAGPDSCGRQISGSTAIRDAFATVWAGMPDVQWAVHRSRILGQEAITEWLFSGTRPDGLRVEIEGLDLFAFEGALVSRKSAFRKDRPPAAA